jgi:hypothetical protein
MELHSSYEKEVCENIQEDPEKVNGQTEATFH